MAKILNKDKGAYLVSWSPKNEPVWGEERNAIDATEEQIKYFKEHISEDVSYLVEDVEETPELVVEEPKVEETTDNKEVGKAETAIPAKVKKNK